MKKIGHVERRKVVINSILHYEEWKLVKRYAYKIASQRDQRKKRTASDRSFGSSVSA